LDNENVASRVKVDESFNAEKIGSITDTGIQKIMLNHLIQEKYQNQKDENGKPISPEVLAFSADGLDDLNANIVKLNNNKYHQPILKVRTFEPKGNKFNIGVTGNKKHKFVEAAKGTNLFFAIYQDESGKRNYESIQLNHVIELQKQGFLPVPELNEKGDKLLFYLSPNDLAYIPSIEEQENPHLVDFQNISDDQIKRIYKVVSFTGNRLYAIQNNVAQSIVDKVEFTQLNKVEFDIENKKSIKEFCWKLKIDRLGNITEVNGKPVL
jgi:CRISPR-associated endonuclease Csn1